jgi:hypothetical protein
MSEEKTAQKLYELVTKLRVYKHVSNYNKIEMGIVLNDIQSLCDNAELEGYSHIDSFNQVLADVHLNKRRVIGFMRNAKYVLDCDIPMDKWIDLDSSVIDLFRKKNINPLKHWDDILTLSYTDLVEVVC